MLSALKGQLKRVIATRADHPRASAPEKILEAAGRLEVPCEAAAPVSAALDRALEAALGGKEIILSAGSMFVTAEVKTAWENRNQR